MTSKHWCVYVTAPNETVHMLPGESLFAIGVRALCGQAVAADWVSGDETISGIAATCGTCRKVQETPKRKRD